MGALENCATFAAATAGYTCSARGTLTAATAGLMPAVLFITDTEGTGFTETVPETFGALFASIISGVSHSLFKLPVYGCMQKDVGDKLKLSMTRGF